MSTTTAPTTTTDDCEPTRATWLGRCPQWCESISHEHEAVFFADLQHWHDVGNVDLALEVYDGDGKAPSPKSRGEMYPTTAAVILRGGIGSAATVVLHLDGPGYDIGPDLTAPEARDLARLLTAAADLLDGLPE